MECGVLGTGIVGQTIGSALVRAGHHVMMGSRSASNKNAISWVENTGPGAHAGTFKDAARFGELLFNCTNGSSSLNALELAGELELGTKILIDVASAVTGETNGLPRLTYSDATSLAEEIQKKYPKLDVVKTLNTMSCELMVAPEKLEGTHNLFVAGNNSEAKSRTRELLCTAFGWPETSMIDLGDLSAARATEALLPLWMLLWKKVGHTNFNFSINGL